MFLPERIGRFFLLAATMFAALMIPWPGTRSAYAAFFRSLGNVAFTQFWFWSDGGVRFLDLHNLGPGDVAPGTPSIEPGLVKDTLMELRNRSVPGAYGYLHTSSRYIGFAPTALTAALVLATPLPWARRLRASLWALLLIHAFILLRLSLTICANGFAADKPYALFRPSPFWRGVMDRAESVLSDNPTVSFVVPVVIWLLVAAQQRNRGAQRPVRPT